MSAPGPRTLRRRSTMTSAPNGPLPETLMPLPPELDGTFTNAQVASFRRIFVFYDADKSGTIDRGEITKVLEKLGEDTSASRLDKIMADFDSNGEPPEDHRDVRSGPAAPTLNKAAGVRQSFRFKARRPVPLTRAKRVVTFLGLRRRRRRRRRHPSSPVATLSPAPVHACLCCPSNLRPCCRGRRGRLWRVLPRDGPRRG